MVSDSKAEVLHADCWLRSVLGSHRLPNCEWEIFRDGAGLLRPKTCWGSCSSKDWWALASRIISGLWLTCMDVDQVLHRSCTWVFWKSLLIGCNLTKWLVEYLAVAWRKVSAVGLSSILGKEQRRTSHPANWGVGMDGGGWSLICQCHYCPTCVWWHSLRSSLNSPSNRLV